MKSITKGLALLLVLLFVIASPIAVFAKAGSIAQNNIQVQDTNENDDEDKDEEEKVKDEETQNDSVKEDAYKDENEDDEIKPWEATKDLLEKEKDLIEAKKDAIEDQIDILEEQYEEAKEAGQTEQAAQLLTEIKTLKEAKADLKIQMKQKKLEMKKLMQEKYTQQELEKLDKVTKELKTQRGIKVLPVTNVFVKNRDVKFDTPPVIKEGRTLIPIRAISEATGAQIQWYPEDKKIVITKESTVMVLYINELKLDKNGVEIKLDVPAEIMNKRTIVPLRFIIENLNLEVNWDSETEIIEIE